MKHLAKIILIICLSVSNISSQEDSKMLLDVTYIDTSGHVIVGIDKGLVGKDLLMVASLASGVGSNDLGLDRGKLRGEKVVRFEKHGNKLLLVQPNLDFRAISSNKDEVLAVEEAFAKSVLYGFKIMKNSTDMQYVVDITSMLLEDLNDVVGTLRQANQGTYKVDATRSAIYENGLLAFEKNVELESIITLVGEAKGGYIRSVTPTPDAVTFRQHVSFIELPTLGSYKPRVFHPHSGYFNISYYDYATPINEAIQKRYITRHRLEKKNPDAERSEPVEPIIYYVDRGCPEPIKSALIEGASWWNQAFEAAGYVDAFEVRELPEGAHPLDVRYNMIQWVHRSTRGWSYGASIVDPRTGEILKGHVSLGSLRVRQDYLIAQGLLSPFSAKDVDDGALLDMSLDRLLQLSAHEVGHTLGLAHNFAASHNDRASVMDYPHPYVTSLTEDAVRNAYAKDIGAWDKRAILYGYGIPAKGQNETSYLASVIDETKGLKLRYISDEDARSLSSPHAYAHLWDNGQDAISELNRVMNLRSKAMNKFGSNSIPEGTPYSELEKVLTPLYFGYRYQAEAVGKLIGGYDYEYAVKGDNIVFPLEEVPFETQKRAINELLDIITIENLAVSNKIMKYMYPAAHGYPRSRESLPNNTEYGMDIIGMQEAAIAHVFEILLDVPRVNRLMNSDEVDPATYFVTIGRILDKKAKSNGEKELAHTASIIFVKKLLSIYDDPQLSELARMYIHDILHNISLNTDVSTYALLVKRMIIDFFNTPVNERSIKSKGMLPPGSPIGMECDHFCTH